jgi:hypothetical protein
VSRDEYVIPMQIEFFKKRKRKKKRTRGLDKIRVGLFKLSSMGAIVPLAMSRLDALSVRPD